MFSSNFQPSQKVKPLALSAGYRLILSAMVGSPFIAMQAHAQSGALESVLIQDQSDRESTAKPYSIINTQNPLPSNTGSLGDFLKDEPGISATQFGPNSSRPIIRGQDGDRIRILRNSSPSVDASSLSFDHALPFDLLGAERIEVLRGPAALAYGGSAVGGAINVVDERIAREGGQGLSGRLVTDLGGANSQTASGAQVKWGRGLGFNISADGSMRRSKDLSTPLFTAPNGVRGNRVINSSASSESAGLGASWVHEQGYVGVSAEDYQSEYGVPKSEEVRIRLDNTRYALEGAQNFARSPLQQLKWRFSQGDYTHQEFEGGKAATRFSNKGEDGRLEARFAWATLGAQWENARFSALGEEAFVPSTQTQAKGLFALGQFSALGLKWDWGLRSEQVDVSAKATGSNLPGQAVEAQGFEGPGLARRFTPQSAALSAAYSLNPQWVLGSSVASVQRAPSSFELFADGLHVATDAYELGNRQLSKERSRHLDVNLAWKQNEAAGNQSFKASAYLNRYSNYIALLGRSGPNALFTTTNEETGETQSIQIFDFAAVPAEFKGLELTWSDRWKAGRGQLSPRIALDTVQGKRTDTGENLPRIAPLRLNASASYAIDGWKLTAQALLAARSKAGAGDTTTPGYTLVNLLAERPITWGQTQANVFAKVSNLTDQLAYSATTVNTVRGFSPFGGRAVSVGVRWNF